MAPQDHTIMIKLYSFSFWMTIIINNNLHLCGLKKIKINNDVIDYRK